MQKIIFFRIIFFLKIYTLTALAELPQPKIIYVIEEKKPKKSTIKELINMYMILSYVVMFFVLCIFEKKKVEFYERQNHIKNNMQNGLEGVFQTIINSFQKPEETIKDLVRTDSEIEDKEATLVLFFLFAPISLPYCLRNNFPAF